MGMWFSAIWPGGTPWVKTASTKANTSSVERQEAINGTEAPFSSAAEMSAR